MSTIRWWAVGRRIQYGLGFASVWILIGAWIYFVNFYQPPSCFDRTMNGEETGVDCGGSCVQICAANLLPPQIVWTKSFKIVDGQYNAMAYVENANQTAATPELEYTFQLLNKGQVVAERSGKTILPPNSIYPIFEGKVFTDGQAEVTDTNLILKPAELWLPASVGRDQFRSIDIKLTGADERPRLDVKLENTHLTPADGVEVVATIFSDDGEPVTASQTFVDQIGPRSVQNIVFTWPNSIAKTVKSCVIPTDVAVGIDLSGSMNNDGGNPPQPVTSALQAASQFVSELQEKDQVSVVTFGSYASVATELTNLHSSVANEILGLTIAPEAETGWTNTIDALDKSREELSSERHNEDARRVLVLLTDGLPTAANDDNIVAKTVAKARGLNENNIEVYSIGLGAGVDEQFIKDIASSPETAYLAPTVEDLNKIYATITSSLCTSGPTKIDVIAKTKTNFVPVR